MQQPLFKSAFNKSKVIPFEKQTENQNLFKTQDLEILSSIVTFATFISCSSKITTTSYINIFRAHDIVLRKPDLQSRNTYYNDCDDDDKLLKTNTSDIEFGLKSKNESLTTSTDQLDVILNDSMSYQSNNLDDDCIDFKQSDKIILSKFSPKEKVKLKNILRNWKSYTIQVRQNRTKVVQQLRLSINFYQKNLLKKFFKKFHKSCKSVQSKRILLKKESDAFYISNFFNKCKEFLLDVMNNWHSIAVNKSTKNALLTKSYKIWRTKFIYSLLTKDNQQIMLDKYFEILNSVPKRYAYFDDDINKTLTQKAFEKWKERYKNYILLSEVADVKFLQWREALQRRKIMSKTASVPLLNRCLLEWYSRTIQKYKQKEHERKLALEVLREWKKIAGKNYDAMIPCQDI
ncbi:2138_t:CDS:10 [Entrophospora sp. SA101]|nr:2138_t:CDS:10 [Entrophospora sp. SA101]